MWNLCGSVVYWGIFRVSGKENGSYYIVYWCYIGITDKMLTTIYVVHWGLFRVSGNENGNDYMVNCGFIGIIGKKMETTICCIG